MYEINLLWRSLYLGGLGAQKGMTQASARIEIPGYLVNNMVMLTNLGGNTIFIKMGTDTVESTIDCFPILAGQQVYLPLQQQGQASPITNIAGVCDSGLTSTLLINGGIAAFQ